MPRPTDTPGLSWQGSGRVLFVIRFICGSSDEIGEVGDPPCGVDVDVCGRWLVLVLVDGVGIDVGIGAIVWILKGEGMKGGEGRRGLNVTRHHPW